MNEKLMNKNYYCHFELTLDLIGGKWKPLILYYLGKHVKLRYSEIRKHMPTINQRVLTRQLEELKNSKLIIKEEYQSSQLKVEYSLSKKGNELIPILNSLKEWGKSYNNEIGHMDVLSIDERRKIQEELELNEITLSKKSKLRGEQEKNGS